MAWTVALAPYSEADAFREPWPSSCHSTVIVDCWIGIAQDAAGRVVRVAGRLGEAQVPDLLRACSEPGPLQLDLSDLVSTDSAGLDALHRVQARGAIFVGLPEYIQLRLASTYREQDRGTEQAS